MGLLRRFVPWWVPVGMVLILALDIVAATAFDLPVPYWLNAVAIAALLLVAGTVAGGPGRARLERAVSPAEVFTVELDEGSRSQISPALTESWFHLVVQDDGLAFWSLNREPQLAALVPWDALENSTVDLTTSVAIEPVGGGGIYLAVKKRPAELLRRRSPSATRLYELLTEHLTPAHPGAAHTPHPARSG